MQEKFFKIAERVESLSGIIDPNQPETLLYAQGILSSIISDLNVMASDNTATGSDGQSPNMIEEVKGLLEQTKGLKGHIDRAISIRETMGFSDQQEASQPDQVTPESSPRYTSANSNNGDDDDSEPLSNDEIKMYMEKQSSAELRREEISVLLMLVATAYKAQLLTQDQRGFLKNQIVRRLGVLRVILQLNDIPSQIEALRTISTQN
jgi:hypothetical protein